MRESHQLTEHLHLPDWPSLMKRLHLPETHQTLEHLHLPEWSHLPEHPHLPGMPQPPEHLHLPVSPHLPEHLPMLKRPNLPESPQPSGAASPAGASPPSEATQPARVIPAGFSPPARAPAPEDLAVTTPPFLRLLPATKVPLAEAKEGKVEAPELSAKQKEAMRLQLETEPEARAKVTALLPPYSPVLELLEAMVEARSEVAGVTHQSQLDQSLATAHPRAPQRLGRHHRTGGGGGQAVSALSPGLRLLRPPPARRHAPPHWPGGCPRTGLRSQLGAHLAAG